GPKPGFEPIDKWWDQHLGGQLGTYYLRYFGEAAPTSWAVDLPKDELKGGERFKVDVLDTWNMTVTPIEGAFDRRDGHVPGVEHIDLEPLAALQLVLGQVHRPRRRRGFAEIAQVVGSQLAAQVLIPPLVDRLEAGFRP